MSECETGLQSVLSAVWHNDEDEGTADYEFCAGPLARFHYGAA